MEYSSMSERILRSLESIIKNDLELEDFTIVPTEDNSKNKSPVLYESHHLGLESWCVKYVYQYICTELFKVRKSLAEKKLGYLIGENLNYILMGGLFINPDVNTFWNMKRELVESDKLGYEEEFRFSKLILTRKHKSNEAFAYRRWLLKRILEKMSKNGIPPSIGNLENELAVTSAAADGSQNNYHAWTHRIWCMEHFLPYFPDILAREMHFSEKWINEHVSENTGYHYRQFLINLFKSHRQLVMIPRYFHEVTKRLNLFNDDEPIQLLIFLLGKPPKNKSLEDISKYINIMIVLLYELLAVIENINDMFTEHECLWLHRRYILYNLVQIADEYLGEPNNTAKQGKNASICFNHESQSSYGNAVTNIVNENCEAKQPKIFKSQPNKFQSSNLYCVLTEREKEFITKNCAGSATQMNLARRYEKWLKLIVGFDLT
ncbi:protein prenyltransferase alpha subunit repeat-containing protein tempura [Rhynchophorus ferrugineus]|uniref:protein prenyltransferase alpha subunit repeat-containing protein tempura n=1 Tax=Rhynchophorus ferrugineus TaxID=354439 RepID=UPI003FCD6E0B